MQGLAEFQKILLRCSFIQT